MRSRFRWSSPILEEPQSYDIKAVTKSPNICYELGVTRKEWKWNQQGNFFSCALFLCYAFNVIRWGLIQDQALLHRKPSYDMKVLTKDWSTAKKFTSYCGIWTRSAQIKIQCSNHWAKESILWCSCQRLNIPTSYAKSARADYQG